MSLVLVQLVSNPSSQILAVKLRGKNNYTFIRQKSLKVSNFRVSYDKMVISQTCKKKFLFPMFGKKVATTDFHAMKNEFHYGCCLKLMENSSIALGKLIIRLNFFKLLKHIEKNGRLNGHIFLCQSFQNFDPIYLKMLYKVILLTIITTSSNIKLLYIHRVFTANSGH